MPRVDGVGLAVDDRPELERIDGLYCFVVLGVDGPDVSSCVGEAHRVAPELAVLGRHQPALFDGPRREVEAAFREREPDEAVGRLDDGALDLVDQLLDLEPGEVA